MWFAIPEDSAASSWASIEAFASIANQGKIVNNHSKTALIIQGLTRDQIKTSTAEGHGETTERAQGSQPQLALKKRISTLVKSKDTRFAGLRRRVSRLFTGPRNASLESQRHDSEVAPFASFPDFMVLKLSGNTRQPAQCTCQPACTSCLGLINPLDDDGSSIADSSTTENYDCQRDENCSQITPTKHDEVNMQLQPIAEQDPLVTLPTGTAYGQIVASFPSEVTVSDHGAFDSRNGGSPIRGLYRNGQMHYEQLVEDQLTQEANERRSYEKAVKDSNDWVTEEVKW